MMDCIHDAVINDLTHYKAHMASEMIFFSQQIDS